MAKGDLAKNSIISKIKEVFGDDYVGEINKKHYIKVKENGEILHIALALTYAKSFTNEQMPTVREWGNKEENNILTPQEEKDLSEMLNRLNL